MAKGKKSEKEQARSADIERIAARLHLMRKVLGLKSSELCRITGIARNTYSQWENRKGRPPVDEARVLRRHFGFTLDWIYEGDTSGLPMRLATALAEHEQRPESSEKAA